MQLEDIKKLANLARIDMSDQEMIDIAKDFDSILAYVGQVQEVSKINGGNSSDSSTLDHQLQNIMRDDVASNQSGQYTEKILRQAPATEDGFLKVKQIL